MKNWLYLFASIFLLMNTNSFSQKIDLIQPTMTPVQAVKEVLLGAGINAFNITYNGTEANANQAQKGVKRFNNTDPNFPISEGLLMHTNENWPLSNIGSDLDMNYLSNGSVTSGSIIEFDFVPIGDTLSFNYIFSSAEYTGYTCTKFNDVFGFFISGPGINGPFTNDAVNIATIPGSANVPVGINTVNSGTASNGNGNPCWNIDPNWEQNKIYFTTSYTQLFKASDIPTDEVYNGSTVLLPANSSLSCNDTFHIKLAIGNVGDNTKHSGVFLEARSFSSLEINFNIKPNNTVISDTMLIEGCTEGLVYFTRPAYQVEDTLITHFEVSGTATSGEDFPHLAPGDSVIFLPGQDSVILVISPIADGKIEGPESVHISTYWVAPCGDTVYYKGTIWIDDEPHSTVFASDTTTVCANDSVPIWAATEGGMPPYTYEWSNGEVGSHTFGSAIENGPTSYVVISTDDCGFEYSDTTTITLNQTLKIDSLVQHPADCGQDNGTVGGYGHVSGYTGTPKYKWTGPGANSSDFANATAWGNKPSGWYYFTITDDVCKVRDSIFLEQNPPPVANFKATPEVGSAPLDVVFTNTSESAATYYWDFGNGESNIVNNTNDQHSTYYNDGVYMVTLVTETGACTDQATKVITVSVSLPLKYDMPNIFTPNGDGQNDLFTLNIENAESLEIVIVNRWGNVVFESSDVNFSWNGTINDTGVKCSDGTYFYKFEIEDMSGNKKEEHGFVQLVND